MISKSPDETNRPSSKSPRLSRLFSRFFKRTSASSSLEYALIIAGITIAIVASVYVLGGSSNNAFKKVGDGMDSITEPGPQTGGNTGNGSGGDSGSSSGGEPGSGSGRSYSSAPGGGSGSGTSDGGSGSDSGGSSGSASGGSSGSASGGGSGSGSGGGSGSASGGSFGSASAGGSDGGSDGGTDDGSDDGSTDRKSGEGAMYAAAGSVNDNRGYGNSSGGLTSDNSGYGSDNNVIGKEENSAGSVDGRNESGNPNKKLTKKISFYKSWLLALILVLGTLLLCMSRKNNKSADDSRNAKAIDLTPKN